jgi:hypothetical protein
MSKVPDLVECYSGAEYAERPRAFYWQGDRLEIAEILESWRTPEGVRFWVSTPDGQIFDLFFEAEYDAWSIVQRNV